MKTTLILASLLISAGALAQGTTNPASSTSPDSGNSSSAEQAAPTFEQLDTNSDGRISLNEAQASPSLATRFSQLDKQNKGYITRQEYRSYMRDQEK